MIGVRHIRFANIGRFVGEHEVDFSDLPQLFQVDAENLNTQGSSGSGKSTLFNAIEYLFGVNETPATILQSRLTKDPISVSMVLDIDGQEVMVTRSKSGGLTIQAGSETISGNNDVAEEYLQKLVGIKPSLFRPMFHKRQGEGGFFLGMRPQEMYEFLTECLNLDVWSGKVEKAEADLKTKKEELEKLLMQKAGLDNSLASFLEAKNTFVAPEKDFNENLECFLENQLKTAQTAYEETKGEYELEKGKIPAPKMPPAIDRSELNELSRQVATLRQEIQMAQSYRQGKLSELNTRLNSTNTQIARGEAKANQQPQLLAQFEEMKGHILEARDNKCPTCKQAWEGGDKDQAFDRLVAKAKALKQTIDENQAEIDGLPNLQEIALSCQKSIALLQASNDTETESKLTTAQQNLTEAQDRLSAQERQRASAYQQEVEAHQVKMASVKKVFDEKLQGLALDVSTASHALSEYQNKKNTYQKLLTQYQTNFESVCARIESTQANIAEVKKDLDALQHKVLVMEQAHKILKAFVNQLFQDTLSDIAHRTNDILKNIPNMSTATLQFEAFKETKTGTIKQQINAVLSVDGEIGVPIKSLSGGERSSVDLAVDFAVIDMIESISGKGIDLFVLDEPFTGLDAQNREQCLEIVRQNLGKKKVAIVDHSAETKAMVPDKILIVREGQTSSVKKA